MSCPVDVDPKDGQRSGKAESFVASGKRKFVVAAICDAQRIAGIEAQQRDK